MRRTGVLGGTFDPIHRGHLDVAEAARQALGLDTVLLIPSRVPPHRTAAPRVSGYHRFAMAALAVADHDGLRISDMELQSPAPSYTSTTLERMTRAGHDRSALFFITGADAFAEIATWHDYPALLDRCHFIVVSRPGLPSRQLTDRLPMLAPRMQSPPGTPSGAAENDATTVWLVDASTHDVSSSEIRDAVASGRSITDAVPPTVAAYIGRHGLYAPPWTASGLHDS